WQKSRRSSWLNPCARINTANNANPYRPFTYFWDMNSLSAEKVFTLSAFFRIIRPLNLLIMAFAQLMTAYFLVETTRDGLPVLLDPALYLLIFATLLVAASG